MPDQRRRRRHDPDQRHARVVRQQQQRRVAQLDIGGAGHHAPDVGNRGIWPDRAGQGRMTKPDPAALLDRGRQRHVVDQCPRHAFHPANSVQRPLADQDRSPGRGGGPRMPSLTQANGYSNWKKNTKAGTSARSAQLSQASRTISDTRSRSKRSAWATRTLRCAGSWTMSASVSSSSSTVAGFGDALMNGP